MCVPKNRLKLEAQSGMLRHEIVGRPKQKNEDGKNVWVQMRIYLGSIALSFRAGKGKRDKNSGFSPIKKLDCVKN